MPLLVLLDSRYIPPRLSQHVDVMGCLRPGTEWSDSVFIRINSRSSWIVQQACAPVLRAICVRGDTDYTSTAVLDSPEGVARDATATFDLTAASAQEQREVRGKPTSHRSSPPTPACCHSLPACWLPAAAIRLALQAHLPAWPPCVVGPQRCLHVKPIFWQILAEAASPVGAQVVYVDADNTVAISAWAMGTSGGAASPASAAAPPQGGRCLSEPAASPQPALPHIPPERRRSSSRLRRSSGSELPLAPIAEGA